MKQHLNNKQLTEASGAQLEYLKQWAIECGYSLGKKGVENAFTIGVLLHFIHDHAQCGAGWIRTGEMPSVRLATKVTNNEFGRPELCDALWEAVKHILREKEI